MVVITNGGTNGCGVVYGGGMLVDSGSSGGAGGSGHVKCEVYCMRWCR